MRVFREDSDANSRGSHRRASQGKYHWTGVALEQRVAQFLTERNWLVHSSWREHHGDLFNPERVPPLLDRLDAIAGEALALQSLFNQLVGEWTVSQGVDPALIEAEKLRILTERGAI